MAESPLRATIESAAIEHGLSLEDLTVMSGVTDPFRLDTPANHRDAKWLADVTASLGLGNRKIHNRGLHYMVLGQTMPNGRLYVSDAKCWEFIEKASKAARWLGYIPFDQITDQRNEAPTIRLWRPARPKPYATLPIEIEIPDDDDIVPRIGVFDFEGTQPYKIVMVGEKSSLAPVLEPIARTFQADLYLPSGDISDTLAYNMARIGAEDGRPMVVMYFADADPAGWNMGIVIARKLQAFRQMFFPDLDFEVHRVALTVEQVREFGLPSTPLKASERRADKWRAAMGVEQTEIDALATLRPDLLRELAREAMKPFYDFELDRRVQAAFDEWTDRAIEIISASLDDPSRARLRELARVKLAELREQVDALNDALRIDLEDFDLPPIVIPEARIQGLKPEPLFDSAWSFVEGTQRLKRSRAYETGGAW
jgi:hypothetical protein